MHTSIWDYSLFGSSKLTSSIHILLQRVNCIKGTHNFTISHLWCPEFTFITFGYNPGQAIMQQQGFPWNLPGSWLYHFPLSQLALIAMEKMLLHKDIGQKCYHLILCLNTNIEKILKKKICLCACVYICTNNTSDKSSMSSPQNNI